MIIEFGRWQLRPDKARANWMLATVDAWEKAKSYRRGTAPMGVRYFQWSNLGNAFMYAAGRDLMDDEGTLDGLDAAREICAILDAHVAMAKRSWDEYTTAQSNAPSEANATPQTSE